MNIYQITYFDMLENGKYVPDWMLLEAPAFGVAVEYYCATRGMMAYDPKRMYICLIAWPRDPWGMSQNLEQCPKVFEAFDTIHRLITDALSFKACVRLNKAHQAAQKLDYRQPDQEYCVSSDHPYFAELKDQFFARLKERNYEPVE